MKTQANRTGEHVLSEGNGKISRESIILGAGPALPAGQVLGIKTGTGEYMPYSNVATDGTEVAVGALFAAVPTSATPRPGVAHVRACELIEKLLTGLDAAAKADFKSRLVILR